MSRNVQPLIERVNLPLTDQVTVQPLMSFEIQQTFVDTVMGIHGANIWSMEGFQSVVPFSQNNMSKSGMNLGGAKVSYQVSLYKSQISILPHTRVLTWNKLPPPKGLA